MITKTNRSNPNVAPAGRRPVTAASSITSNVRNRAQANRAINASVKLTPDQQKFLAQIRANVKIGRAHV